VDLLGTKQTHHTRWKQGRPVTRDSTDYLRRVEASMKSVFLEKCNQGLITHEPNLIGTILVSARTGYNIEKLIDKIYGSWRETRRDPGADIYLVGTTNVGKSSIFNSLLESDLCKIKAVDRV
jgi:ribosome biogenesis GTPase A